MAKSKKDDKKVEAKVAPKKAKATKVAPKPVVKALGIKIGSGIRKAREAKLRSIVK